MCRADDLSLKRGFDGKCKEEFIPRWVKREEQKLKPHCCVPGCNAIAERVCPLPLISFVWQPVLSVHSIITLCTHTVNLKVFQSMIITLCTHTVTLKVFQSMIITLCTHTVTLKVFQSMINAGTVLTGRCGGPSNLSPNLKMFVAGNFDGYF